MIGSAGSVGVTFFLLLNLYPVAYIASEAVTAICMHITKIIIYQNFLKIGYNALIFGVFIGVSMILGLWVSKRIIKKLPKDMFQKFIGILLIAISLYMIISE